MKNIYKTTRFLVILVTCSIFTLAQANISLAEGFQPVAPAPVAEAPSNYGDPYAGSTENPYMIETWQNLYWITQNNTYWSAIYVQTADIDLNDGNIQNWDEGKGWLPIGNDDSPFRGIYDGSGYVIENLYINRPSAPAGYTHVGMFGRIDNFTTTVGNEGVLRRIKLVSASVTSDAGAVGGLVGIMQPNTLIDQCSYQGEITGNAVPNALTGGLAGYVNRSTIQQSRALITINVSGNYVGGVAGYLERGTISDSFAKGSIHGTDNSHLGGLIGGHGGATGNRAVISNSYTHVTFHGDNLSNVSGITGMSTGFSNVTASIHWNFYLDQSYDFHGLGSPKTSGELRQASTFSDWDYDSIWRTSTTAENDDLPDLQWYYADPIIHFPPTPPSNYGEPDAGTLANPYLIGTWQELYWITLHPNYWDKAYLQTADIDLNDGDIQSWNEGSGWSPIGQHDAPFIGVYDGDYHTISNLYLDKDFTASHNTGLFGLVTRNGSDINTGIVRNLIVKDAEISAMSSSVAGIAGHLMSNGHIENVSFSGILTVRQLPSGDTFTGGVVGYAHSSSILNSRAEVTVTSSWNYTGGFAGFLATGTYENNFAQGSVNGNAYIGGFTGSLGAGANQITIRNSISNVAVNASIWYGGFSGNHSSSNFAQSGLYAQSGTYPFTSNSFTLLNETEMKQAASFTDLDFDDIWYSNVAHNDGVPDLQWYTDRMTVTHELENLTHAGWQLMSIPVDNLAFSTLAGYNLIQGVNGANSFYNDGQEYETGVDANVFHYNSASQDYEPLASLGDTYAAGHGFIWYMYNNDIGPSTTLPFSMSFEKSSIVESDILVSLDAGWNLLGNPYPFAITTDHTITTHVTSGSLASHVVHAWNPETGSWYQPDVIQPWQAFFVDNNDGQSFNFIPNMEVDASAALVGLGNPQESFRIPLKLDAGNVSNQSAVLHFHPDAHEAWDVFDARSLEPLSNSWVNLSFLGERNGLQIAKSVESLPVSFTGEIQIPLQVESQKINGEATLSWPQPEYGHIELHDLITGDVISMNDRFSYTFTITEGVETRFNLVVSVSDALSAQPLSELPQKLNLEQNYPNPFNPNTVINYQLPVNSEVRLDVYDMLGRRVAVLVNGQIQAGNHQVQFDASGLASGKYMYRLQAGNDTVIRSMTLIK